MHGAGFEPAKALSHQILSLVRLTTSVPVQCVEGIQEVGEGINKKAIFCRL